MGYQWDISMVNSEKILLEQGRSTRAPASSSGSPGTAWHSMALATLATLATQPQSDSEKYAEDE